MTSANWRDTELIRELSKLAINHERLLNTLSDGVSFAVTIKDESAKKSDKETPTTLANGRNKPRDYSIHQGNGQRDFEETRSTRTR